MLRHIRRETEFTTIMHNGRVLCVDKDFSEHSAIAIRGRHILGVGSRETLKALCTGKFAEVDLGGRTVIPGLIDGHYHFLNRAARSYFGIRLDQYTSVKEILEAIRQKVKSADPGKVILSNAGASAELLDEGRLPSLAELDEVAPDNPIVLTFEEGRLVNSAMLKFAGIDETTPVPEKGVIGKDSKTGRLTGMFSGKAANLLSDPNSTAVGDLGSFTPDELYTAAKWAQPLLNKMGVTGLRNPSLEAHEMTVYQRLWEDKALSVRVAMDINIAHAKLSGDEIRANLGSWGVRQPFGDDWLRIAGVSELWIDHSSDGMLLTWPYKTVPLAGQGVEGYRGIQGITSEKMAEVMTILNELNWRPLVHAGGDAAVDLCLDAFEYAEQKQSIKGKRWVVDHCHLGMDRHIKRILALDAIVGMQFHTYMYYPIFASFYGKEEANHMFPAREWIDAGITVAGGSDYSKVPINLFEGIYFFVTRDTQKWGIAGPEHAVSRQEALRMFTWNAAYQTFEEDIKGSLESGKLADLVVLSDDYMDCPDSELKNLLSEMTMVDGKVQYLSSPETLDVPAEIMASGPEP